MRFTSALANVLGIIYMSTFAISTTFFVRHLTTSG